MKRTFLFKITVMKTDKETGEALPGNGDFEKTHEIDIDETNHECCGKNCQNEKDGNADCEIEVNDTIHTFTRIYNPTLSRFLRHEWCEDAEKAAQPGG